MICVGIYSSRLKLKVKYRTPNNREFFVLYAHDPSMVLSIFVQENNSSELTPDSIFECIMKKYVFTGQANSVKC